MNRIAERRKQVGLTRKELANRVNVAHHYLRNIENNCFPPPLKLLARIAKELDCQVGDLIGE